MRWSPDGGADPVLALRSAPVSILFLLPDLTILDATDRYLADTMRSRAELVGRPLFEAFPENPDEDHGDDGVSALRRSLERVRATLRSDTMPVQRYDIPLPDGRGFERRQWSPINSPVLDDQGRLVLIHHQVTDVTDYVDAVTRLATSAHDVRRLEEDRSLMEREVFDRSLELHRTTAALRSSEERFRLVCDATSDALWDWDTTSDRLWWSDGIERLFGYRRTDLSPMLDSWTTLIHPDDADDVLADLHAAMERGDVEWEREYRFRHRDGHVVWVRDHCQILRDDRGVVHRVVGGMSDITERRLVEQQFLRAQRMESIGMLAGGIAHDLNNVLAPVLMGAELLAHDEADTDRRELLDVIVQSTSRGAAMIQQILTFASGAEAGTTPVGVGELIRDVGRFVKETFPSHLRLEIRVPDPEDHTVPGDVTRLHQVLLNLCVNGRDAMPDGGTLSIRSERLTLSGRPADGTTDEYVVIHVGDTGVGIEPDVVDRIFDPFFSTKGPGHGTGLGLSTSHAIVRDHGGFITVATEPGTGTTFSVHLPVTAEHAAAPAARRTAARGEGQTVLVVDDEESILAITRHTLEASGYRVSTASSGVDAIARVAAADAIVDLAIVDMMMPNLDGPATIAALRRLRPDLEVVVASGLGAVEMADRTTDMEVRHFLAKPYTAAELLDTVHAALSGVA